MLHSACAVCEGEKELSFQATVLKKYKVNYFYCSNCGLLQTEEPYWLTEAYSNPIADVDTGLVQRNINLSRILCALLYFLFDRNGKYLDVAGGYGLLTRLMRDYGYDFYWLDKYCENILAKGFDSSKAKPPFTAVTAFEVLEHIYDPVSFLRECLADAQTKTIIFSTELFREAPPNAPDWYYYAFSTGQHISFYQRRTLEFVASKLRLNLYTDGNFLHVLTDKSFSSISFKALTSRLSFMLYEFGWFNLQSKTMPDHEDLTRKGRECD